MGGKENDVDAIFNCWWTSQPWSKSKHMVGGDLPKMRVRYEWQRNSSPGQTYLGGFFIDAAVPNSLLSGATFAYSGLNGAIVQYVGLVTVPSAAFTTGTVTNGEAMEFLVVPEPGSAALLVLGAGALLGWRRRASV